MDNSNYWKDQWYKHPHSKPNLFALQAYKLIEPRYFKTLLDLGCGDGEDSIFFSNKGLGVTAVDFSESGIDLLQKKSKKIKCLLSDIRKINLPESSFDIVYSHLGLHYFTNKETDKIFEKIYKILSPGGLLFIKCKSVSDPLFGKGRKIEEDMFDSDHVRHFFSREYMKEKLQKFKIIKIRKTSSIYGTIRSNFIDAVASK